MTARSGTSPNGAAIDGERDLPNSRRRLSAAIAFVLAVSGCAVVHQAAAPGVAVSAAPSIEQSRQLPGLLEFVANAAPGQSRIFQDPTDGAVRVTVGRQYSSAAALLCRHFIFAPLDGGTARATQTRAVCRESDGWQLDPIGTTGAVRFSP